MPSNILSRCISFVVLFDLLISRVAAFSSLHSHKRSLAFQDAVPSTHPRPRQYQLLCLSASSNPQQQQKIDDASDPARRQLWHSAAAAVLSSSVMLPSLPAHAGLLQFPTAQLKNRYHFMRAGLSELEVDDIYASNALFLTNRENCLAAAQRGVEESLVAACQKMKDANQLPTVAYHSLAANGMDTGDFMARTLLLARDRLLPEFTYLDPRGIGLWDGTSYETTHLAIMAMDATEAGPRGTGGRPPANTDGTPNETLADQFVRLRQFLSLQESRTSGENILVIFPDGTGPALASAMIAGVPLGSCHALEYAPGEIRLDVTQRSVLELYNTRKDDPEYLAMLERGQEYLQALRQESSKAGAGTFVNRKDRLAEERRDELDKVYDQQQQLKKEAEQKRQEEILLARRAEQERVKEERERQRLEKQQQQQQREHQREKSKKSASTSTVAIQKRKDQSNKSSNLDPLVFGGGLVASAGGLFLANLGNVASPSTVVSSSEGKGSTGTTTATNARVEKEPTTPATNLSKEKPDSEPTSTSSSPNGLSTKPLSRSLTNTTLSPSANTTTSSVDDELDSLEDAQERFHATLLAPETTIVASSSAGETETKESSSASAIPVDDTVQAELDTLERGQTTMEEYMDFDDAWLRVWTEIRDEED